MSHFAKVNAYGIVEEVIVAEQDYIDSRPDASSWVQTSYNTRGGIYYIPNTHTPDPDQSKALRKNYAGYGFTFDPIKDAFIPPKPYDSWSLDDFSCLWVAPIPYPDDGKIYQWNEFLKSWVEIG